MARATGAARLGGSSSVEAEVVSFCEIVSRLRPELASHDVYKHMQEFEARRQRRVRSIEWRVREGTYQVQPGALANAMLVEHGTMGE